MLEVTESDFPSLSNSVHSCLGLSTSACARVSRAACAVASARVCPVASSSAEFAAVAHAHPSILHGARNSGGTGAFMPVQSSTSYCLDNSWSDTGRVKGPTGRRSTKGVVSGPVEDLRPVSEAQGRCGHTFPPPGGSWYPFRVISARIEHQAINGLDEGVWNRTVGELGAKG